MTELEEFTLLMENNFYSWSDYFAPMVSGAKNDNTITQQFVKSFNHSDQIVTRWFLKAALFSDYRHILPKLDLPTLILQSSNDSLVDVSVSKYIKDKVAHSKLTFLNAKGHCLHMTNPREVSEYVTAFITE